MTATLIHAFPARRRKPYVSAEAEGRRIDRVAKDKADAKRPFARFSVKEMKHFHDKAMALLLKGDPDAVRADRLLSQRVRHSESGYVKLAPEAQDAAFLARFLRRREVNGFCTGLARLDEIAGATAPAGRAVDLSPVELVESLELLEAVEGDQAAQAALAAAHLRTATIHRTLARVYVPAGAGRVIGDALHAIGASRITVNKFDGGTGFRPRVRPAP